MRNGKPIDAEEMAKVPTEALKRLLIVHGIAPPSLDQRPFEEVLAAVRSELQARGVLPR